MNLLNQLEVKITKLEDASFKACSDLFPRCNGLGKDETEALKNLSSSITRLITKTTKKFLDQMLCSRNYTSVLLDMNQKNEQRRIFNFNAYKELLTNTMMLRIKPSPNPIKEKDQEDFNLSDAIDKDFLKALANGSVKEADLISVLIAQPLENLFFGVPINYN